MLRRVMKLALAICVGAAFAAEAVGQTPSAPPDMTGWNRVGELRDGQRIIVSVGSGFPIHCVFRGITDHSVFCDTGNLLLGFYKREIARDEVTWLRTDNYPRDRGIVMGVLGTAGVVFGAASAPSSETAALKVDSALLFGLARALDTLPPFRSRSSCPARRSTPCPSHRLPSIFAGQKGSAPQSRPNSRRRSRSRRSFHSGNYA